LVKLTPVVNFTNISSVHLRQNKFQNKFKPKMYEQKSFLHNFCTKKPRIKCW
jgi:hypothetical protein